MSATLRIQTTSCAASRATSPKSSRRDRDKALAALHYSFACCDKEGLQPWQVTNDRVTASRRRRMFHVPRIIPRTAASVVLLAAMLGPVSAALASPGYVNLVAASCFGSGQSYLSYPAGYSQTAGCGASSQYLSATYIRQDGFSGSLPGTWSGSTILFGNTGSVSPVASVAGNHNLQYVTTQSGYYGTNTW